MRGKWIRLSIPRRVVTDLMYFSSSVPWIVAQRNMALKGVAAAREAHPERPTWAALFVKAFALVAREFPELRRVYVALPIPHLYEYPSSVASIAVERKFDDELGVVAVKIKSPDLVPLARLGWLIRDGKSAAYARTSEFRRMVLIASMPLPIRRALWWLALSFARTRANYFGTFGLSTVASLGTEILQPRAPLTTVLTYGVIGRDGSVVVRAVFDHRVLDAMTMARALRRLEESLNGSIHEELISVHSTL